MRLFGNALFLPKQSILGENSLALGINPRLLETLDLFFRFETFPKSDWDLPFGCFVQHVYAQVVEVCVYCLKSLCAPGTVLG